MGRDVTLVDVARAAGVSTATAGRVLGGYANVCAEKSCQVREAAKALGYRPNRTAQALKSGNTKTIAAIVGCIDSPYTAELVDAVDIEARREGYSVLICNTHLDPDVEYHYLRDMQARQVDGIILMPTHFTTEKLVKEYQELTENGVNVVGVDRPAKGLAVPVIQTDNEQMSYEATKYLLELGHERIGVVAREKEWPWIVQRMNGYMRALEEKGVPFDESLVVYPSVFEESEQPLIESMLSESNPTAVYVLQCDLCQPTVMALREKHLRIPEDISLLTWDDAGFNELLGLTSVEQRVHNIGRRAMEYMLDPRKSQMACKTDCMLDLLDGSLNLRSSCAPPAKK